MLSEAVCENVSTTDVCRLSRNGKTIIFSIHQPRYSIFKLFDSLTLLADGHMIFHGPAQQALSYFGTHGEPHFSSVKTCVDKKGKFHLTVAHCPFWVFIHHNGLLRVHRVASSIYLEVIFSHVGVDTLMHNF